MISTPLRMAGDAFSFGGSLCRGCPDAQCPYPEVCQLVRDTPIQRELEEQRQAQSKDKPKPGIRVNEIGRDCNHVQGRYDGKSSAEDFPDNSRLREPVE